MDERKLLLSEVTVRNKQLGVQIALTHKYVVTSRLMLCLYNGEVQRQSHIIRMHKALEEVLGRVRLLTSRLLLIELDGQLKDRGQ